MPIQRVYLQLLDHYGEQAWWPAESAFEVIVGAVLTQNTAWTNVEKALSNLKLANELDPHEIVAIPQATLADLIRPSGYFNIKAKRLKNVCQWLVDEGGLPALSQWTNENLRQALLNINGVGPETADDIMLYAFHRPVFVIDAYTRRLFSRLGLVDADAAYESLRAVFEEALKIKPEKKRVQIFNNYHALIVQHGKNICKKNRPLCDECHLSSTCKAVRIGV